MARPAQLAIDAGGAATAATALWSAVALIRPSLHIQQQLTHAGAAHVVAWLGSPLALLVLQSFLDPQLRGPENP